MGASQLVVNTTPSGEIYRSGTCQRMGVLRPRSVLYFLVCAFLPNLGPGSEPADRSPLAATPNRIRKLQ